MDHGNAQNIDTNIAPNSPVFPGVEHLLVREWFMTIQGEEPFAGHTAIFLRLGGCNLGAKDVCVSCDTSFEVSKSAVYDVYSLAEEILEEIRTKGYRINLLVVTGGEPLLQLPAVLNLLRALSEVDKSNVLVDMTVQFETNGTIDPSKCQELTYFLDEGKYELDMLFELYFVVSPKVFKKDHEANWWFNYDGPLDVAIRQVISPNPDSAFHWPEYLDHEATEMVYLSPVTLYTPDGQVDMDATRKSINYAVERALKGGFNLSLQSHVFAGIR